MGKVLVGFERSGMVRRALRARGIDAWSCDIEPADDNSPHHLCCDVFDIVDGDWSGGIFHPVCTYLTGAAAWAFKDGPYHQKVKPGTITGQARRDARGKALDDVRRLMALPYPHAIENPRGFIGSMIRKPDQTVQPYQFGDDASKATCLWLHRLPPLVPTKQIAPRMVGGKPRWANQTDSGQNRLPPSNNRAAMRSKTYQGIASAIADQWGERLI